MHPIIKEFIQSESIADILAKLGTSQQPVEAMIPIVMAHISKRILPSHLLKEIDGAIETGHPDEEVFALFISHLIVFYSIQEMPKKGESVYHISKGFNFSKYCLEVQALYYQSCAFYFYHCSSDFSKRDELNLLSLSLMPKSSPRYKAFIYNAGNILALDGCLYLLSQSEIDLLDMQAKNYLAPAVALLNNALHTVDLIAAEKYYNLVKDKYSQSTKYDIEHNEIQMSLLRGISHHKPFPKNIDLFVSYYQSLKNRDFHTSIKLFAALEKSESQAKFYFAFYFIKLHHMFVTGWFEEIEKILADDNMNRHYMTDFFITRYFLLKKDLPSAQFYWGRLLKNCKRFKAINRLRYELTYAMELSPDLVFDLLMPNENLMVSEKPPPANSHFQSELLPKGIHAIVGSTTQMIEIKRKVLKYANIQRPILIVGETGAGKEIIAKAIHQESDFCNQPFLAINCGSLTDTLLQSELFGYEPGAFTGAISEHKGIFEMAGEGTVFLDEFGEMSQKLQISLLRVLENNEILRVGGTKIKKIKCRIIAATNSNIEDLISRKLFREDLYHRLKQFVITVPPLREHKKDIEELIHFFLEKFGNKQELSPLLMKKFLEYSWPGNIRELKNELDRIKIICGNKPIINIEDVDIEWIQKTDPLDNPKQITIREVANLVNGKDHIIHQRIQQKKLKSIDKRRLKIKELFEQYKKLTRAQIAEALEISPLTATKDLHHLCDEGFITKKTPTPSPQSHFFEIQG